MEMNVETAALLSRVAVGTVLYQWYQYSRSVHGDEYHHFQKPGIWIVRGM
jgi:hypothetical protein